LGGRDERLRFTFHPARLDRPRDLAKDALKRSAEAAKAVKAFATEQAKTTSVGVRSSSSSSSSSGGHGGDRAALAGRSMAAVLAEPREQWEQHLAPSASTAEALAAAAVAAVARVASTVLVLTNMLTAEALGNDDEHAEVGWLDSRCGLAAQTHRVSFCKCVWVVGWVRTVRAHSSSKVQHLKRGFRRKLTCVDCFFWRMTHSNSALHCWRAACAHAHV
jgi:hypothetical protein